MSRVVAIVALVLAAPCAYAQWEKVPQASVPRTRDGAANLTAPAPKGRARKPDLSGVWLADSEPLPQEAGLTIEGDMPFPRYMVNVLADVPFEQAPLQPWAAELFQKRLQSGGTDDPVAHCKPTGLPLLNTAPVPFKLVQMPDLVVLLYEENSVFRQIFLDGRKPVDDPVPQALGYSTGRWEGRELVVDTVGFSDRHWLDAMGHPLTEQLHLVERFRRPDAGHLEIETTIDDKGAYTKPFTYTVKLTLIPDDDLLEYFCTDNEKDSQHYQ
ncbi:MAG TPA: hypothetical protein VM692_17295 [Gammaproteobacteria bacterium]|nr:hypothetical protein [Gammaproteobacteria bacterium]